MSGSGAAEPTAIGKPLHELSAREAVGAMARGALSSEAYVEALLAWQARWRVLNAYTQQDADAARQAARRAAAIRSPISGLPIAVKDNVDVAGYATTGGTPGLRHHRPRANAPLIQTLIDQGAVMMGKVGLHEMAAGGTCGNITFGQIRNPYNAAMVPGGSSGGSAAAVAARLVPASIGTDTAGSVRAPAAYCGCVGFKPTTGRYSRIGVVPGDVRRDTIGWLARSCGDIELLDASCVASAAPEPPVDLRGLRLGVPRAYFYETMQPELAAVVEAAPSSGWWRGWRRARGSGHSGPGAADVACPGPVGDRSRRRPRLVHRRERRAGDPARRSSARSLTCNCARGCWARWPRRRPRRRSAAPCPLTS